MNENKDWFKLWFNSKYYHILYSNRSQSEANIFIDNIISRLALKKQHNILDLGCGKGRHAFQLSKYFNEVDGLDLSEKSINKAKEFSKENLQFHKGDMRDFDLQKKFSYIFNLFTSFGYFDDISQNINVLNCCNKQLKSNGFLLIDFLNPKLIKKKIIIEENKLIDGVHFNIKKSIKNNHIIKNINILDGDEKSFFQERVQLFDIENFKSLFNQTGFELAKSFGNYQLDSYSENSERSILWAKKKEL
tara:strand:+ start:165 stop:905 length:741 start_codon:yes stop_codon:yes gene_type:complete